MKTLSRSVKNRGQSANQYILNLTFPNGKTLDLKGNTKLDAKNMIMSDRTLKAIYKQYGLFSTEAIDCFRRTTNFDLARNSSDTEAIGYLSMFSEPNSIKIICTVG